MPIEVTMPRLSDTMEQGTVVKWNVKEGDKVKTGDVIADIETDKATMELQTYDDGVVAKLAVSEGQTVKVGAIIMVLAGAGEKANAASTPAAAPAQAPVAKQEAGQPKPSAPSSTAVADRPTHATNSSSVVEPRGGGRVFASPLAKKIAEEAGVTLDRVEGTGPSGRITRKDVEDLIARGGPADALPTMKSPDRGAKQLAAAQVPPTPAVMVPPPGAMLTGRIVTLSNMRRVIAKRLVESKTTIPHYQVTVEAEMDALLALRKQLNDQLESQGVKLSVNDFLVRACALAMHQHPFVNSRWLDKGGAGGEPAIEILADVNIGVAVALPEERGGGLVVATLRNADRMGLRQVSAQTKALADKARTKGLTVEEMADSTFTISNLGMFGVSHFNAIINPPNVAILAVGAAIQKPIIKNGQLAVGSTMSMTMSSDHRVVDGAMAAQYLATVRQMLEKPATLLV